MRAFSHYKSIILRLFKEKKAAALLEFAVIFPMFFALFLLVVESAFLYLNTTFMEAGMEAGKRFIMTGQMSVYQANPSKEDLASGAFNQEQVFRKVFCEKAATMFSCQSIKFDIRSFDAMGTIKMAVPVVDGKLNTSAFAVNAGNSCDVVVARAYYETKSVSGFFRSDVKKLEGFNSVISVSTAFRNAPYNKC